jgi:hypothetical protein
MRHNPTSVAPNRGQQQKGQRADRPREVCARKSLLASEPLRSFNERIIAL